MAAADAGGLTPDRRARAAAHRAAYAKGLAGEAAGEAETNDPRLRATYRKGQRAARGEEPVRKTAAPANSSTTTAAPTKPAPAPAKSQPGKGFPAAPVTQARRIGASSGGFVLGMFAYALAINYLRYGMAGVKALLSAKALNKVTPGPWSSSGTPASSPGVGEGPGQRPFYLVPPGKSA